MTIAAWLEHAYKLLAEKDIPSARLDAQLLLCFSTTKNLEYLASHSDEHIASSTLKKANCVLQRRLQREPIAYITGVKEFYGRDFTVTPDTLIPRPETETIVELFKKYTLHGRVLDVGTGSGCIGLTLKAEIPDIDVTVSDISNKVLDIARKNAKKLGIKPVRFVQSDLLDHWLSHEKPKKFDVIVANLPYVDAAWEVSPETKFEPSNALFSNDHGLEHTKRLLRQSIQLIQPNGYILIETDPRQHNKLRTYTVQLGYKLIKDEGLIQVFKKD